MSVRHLGHLINVKRTLPRKQIALSVAVGGDEVVGRDLIDPEPVLAKVTQQIGSSVDYWLTSQTGNAAIVIFGYFMNMIQVQKGVIVSHEQVG